MSTNPPQCIETGPDCHGIVACRPPFWGTGRVFPRCEHHWGQRLDKQLLERYPSLPPVDFDPDDVSTTNSVDIVASAWTAYIAACHAERAAKLAKAELSGARAAALRNYVSACDAQREEG